jgi:hypothetical protein
MSRHWFNLENCSLPAADRAILNRAMRHLVDDYNLLAMNESLALVRQCYKPGMSARDLIVAVNEKRGI